MNKPYFYIILLGTMLIAFFVLDGFFGVDFIVDASNRPIEAMPEPAKVVPTPADNVANDPIDEPAEETSAVSTASDLDSGDSFEKKLQDYQDSLLSILGTGERRQDIVVRYYPHVPDGDVIYGLNDLGYYVHERPATEGLDDLATNSIYYGDDIDIRDIQIIARYLVENDVILRQIRPSRFHADWKSNAIEIGTSVQAADMKPLTLEDIMLFQKEF